VIQRAVGTLVFAALLLGLAIHAGATTPEGPRLTLSAFTNGSGEEGGNDEVITTDPLGGDPQRLVGGPGASIGAGLSWSADGGRLAFAASGVKSTASGPYGTGWQVVGVVRADGSGARAYPRAFLNAGEPVMAPDGGSVVFQRLKLVKELPGRENLLLKSAIWSLDVRHGTVRRLTRWRLAVSLNPVSFSPDSSTLAAEFIGRGKRDAMAIDLHGHLRSRLARKAQEPTYSPDGTRLAFVRERNTSGNKLPQRPISELWVARADGSAAKRLLRMKGYISFPSWDPSGSRLSFTRNPPAEATGDLEPEPGNKVMEINADGTCLTKVFSDPEVTVLGSAWQPGVGREAGPISC
jgi:Tol biopolymer transport system component